MPSLIIKNAKLLDTQAAELRAGASLRIEDDKIVDVAEDGRELTTDADSRILDAEGRTLMPGLIDAHVHPAITTLDLSPSAPARRPLSGGAMGSAMVRVVMMGTAFRPVRGAPGFASTVSQYHISVQVLDTGI